MNLEELKQKIAEEEAEAREILKQYNQREDRLKALKSLAITKEFGVKVGSIVVGRHGEFLVTNLNPGSYGSSYLWLKGRKKTKDGWSKSEQTITNWTLKSESP